VTYTLRRLLLTLPLLAVVSFVVFLVGASLPGDPAVARFDVHANPRAVAAWKAERGLDQPLLVRYGRYVHGVVTRLDFGESYVDDRPIGPTVLGRFAATFELSLSAMLLAVPVGVLVGVLSAVRRGRLADHAASAVALFGISVPVFWLGTVLMLVAVSLGFVKLNARYDLVYEPVVAGYTTRLYALESLVRGRFDVAWSCAQYLLVPALALSTIPMAFLTRMTRSAVLEEVRRDYVQTARAKGLPGRRVVLHHVLRNALIPVVTVTGLQTGALLSGAVLTESVFNWPGLGTYILAGVRRNDAPVLVAGILVVATVFILVNLAVDLLYGVLDPRLRRGEGT
jgi:peptide/nickel transport system permease protein